MAECIFISIKTVDFRYLLLYVLKSNFVVGLKLLIAKRDCNNVACSRWFPYIVCVCLIASILDGNVLWVRAN